MNNTARIRELNDELRQHFRGGKVLMTPGVNDLTDAEKAVVLDKVMHFKNFNNDNDPHGEHDFLAVEHDGIKYFAKIDYYAPDMVHGSDDPSDPNKTTRVLTIMRADEY